MNAIRTLVKTPLMTSTLKAGICLSLALHAALWFGVKYFWHRPAFPMSPIEHTVTITMAAGEVVDSAPSVRAAPIYRINPQLAYPPAPVGAASRAWSC